MKENYERNFYNKRHQRTLYAAQTVLGLLRDILPGTESAVDFGCGVGTWLSVLRDEGAQQVLGLDGHWVDEDLLVLARDEFRQVDFEQPIRLPQRYDLALSLEVAEHISAAHAEQFVQSITDAADFVLFSAAIPHQGGIGHINLQWPQYWVGLFAEKGYVAYDVIRPLIWEDQRIQPWYRQNALVFARREREQALKLPRAAGPNPRHIRTLVHPEMYLRAIRRLSGDGEN